MVFEPGRLCVKNAGRESGKYCVVLSSVDKDHVLVTGPKPLTGVRRRKCSVLHLEPTPQLLKLKKDASDSDVLDAFKKEKLFDSLGLKELSEADLKKWEDEQKVREAKKKTKEEAKPATKAEEPKEEFKKEEKKETKPKAEKKPAAKKE